jgi:outer membrane protein assembly factor BamB
MRNFSFTFASLTLCLALTASADDNWPQFRGSAGQGHSTSTDLPLTWSETQNVKWKTPIPGEGWSSPVIWGEQVWMTTALNGGRSFRAICVDKGSGKVLRDIELFTTEQPQHKNLLNSYASPTPCIEEGRVYVCFGTYGSACLDTKTGEAIWKTQELKIDHMEGPGSSPILYKGLFILHCDGTDQQYIVALDKNTGKIAWKVNRSYPFGRMAGARRKAFCTPLLIQIDGHDRLISIAAWRLYCYDPNDGKELWFFDMPGYSNASPPVFTQGMLIFSTGFDKADLYAIRTDNAAGDVTKTHFAWKDTSAIAQKPAPLLVGDELYMINDTGVGRCFEAKTGKSIWQKRLTATCNASPIYADGRIYIFSDQGQSIVIKPGDAEPEILATNTLEAGCMATPAISGKAIFIRTKTHLYRIEKPQ